MEAFQQMQGISWFYKEWNLGFTEAQAASIDFNGTKLLKSAVLLKQGYKKETT